MSGMNQNRTAFSTFAWILLGYNILVVLWGAFVRATGSGAGCGSHWPLCNGEVIPHSPELETIIEFSHRLTSGLLGLLVLWMAIWAFRAYGRGHAVRKAALWTLFFVITEAAIGAGLVKFEWVAADTSIERVYTMAFHLLNTFFLLAANTLTAWFGGGGKPFSVRQQGSLGLAIGGAFLGMLVLGTSGAITALGDTLSITMGITAEQSPLVATLVSLRIYHPLLAFVAFGLLYVAARVIGTHQPGGNAIRYANMAVGLFAAQLVVGGLNVYLKAPAWMQLLHLLITDFIWVLMVMMAASALSKEQAVDTAIRRPSGEPVLN